MLKSIECCFDSVDSISGAKGLGKDISDTCCITNKTNSTTCLNTSSRNSRLEEYRSTLILADNIMRNCISSERNGDKMGLSLICCLPYCIGDIVSFTKAIAYSAITIAYNDKSGE